MRVKITYLQMLAHPPRVVPPPRAGLAVVHAKEPTVAYYRFLYDAVGREYDWTSRKKLSDAGLAALLSDPRLEVHVLMADGVPAGFAELDRRIECEIELVQFGLMPDFIGQGLGRYFLRWAIDRAWSYGPRRFWLHTCTKDHPAALPNYLKAGFAIYKEEVTDQGSDDACPSVHLPFVRGSAVVPAIQRTEPGASPGRRRIVLTTFGSLGDLHPYIAVALGLQARGHEAVIATSAYYRQKIEALGIGFRAVRPDHPDPDADAGLMRRIMDRRTGSEVVIRELMMPVLRESYEDTLAAAQGADLLVSHMLTFTTRLVAEKQGIPWASTFLQPLGLFSVYDPPVLPPAPFLAKLRFLGPAFHRPLFWCARRSVRSWCEPWHRLRAEVGLPPTSESPLFEGQHSPALVLALFSKLLADKQPDWPPQTVLTGFPFYDQDGEAGMPSELACFLDAGPPPLVFTLGSSAVVDAGPFYDHSATAAKLLGRRAVLLVGKNPRNRPASLPDGIVAFAYAPFSELFPRAAAIVHQGGIGTTAQAMRSGRPMLVMPYAHDQPDNAERVTRLGIARTVSRHRYSPARAAAELRHLLDNPAYSQRASAIGAEVREEDGVRAACDALEDLIQAARLAGAVEE